MPPHESMSSSSRSRIAPLSMQILAPTRALPPRLAKMSLPAELLERIVDYMPVQTQLRFARTNHAMKEMIYDDSRWVTKLKAMGVWNEEDARRAAEEEITRRREATQRAKEEAVLGRAVTNGSYTTLFDQAIEQKKFGVLPAAPVKTTDDLLDLQLDSPEGFGEFQSVSAFSDEKLVDSVSPLSVLSSVISRRGLARSEFGRVYGTLSPLYIDLANSNSLEESAVFRHRRQLEDQAKLLRILELFGRTRAVDNWTRCQKRIAWITETFERQMLIEFEKFSHSATMLTLGHMMFRI